MLNETQILARLDEIGAEARSRMVSCDPWLTTAMGGAEIDFMTDDERQERHCLILALPTMAEERQAAMERIQARIAARKTGKDQI